MNYRFYKYAIMLTLVGMLAVAPAAFAQPPLSGQSKPAMVPMQVLQGPQEPYTESIAAMVARDAKETKEILAGIRPPRMSMAKYHEHAELEETVEEAMQRTLQIGILRPQPRLKPTPYLGTLDISSHFLKGSVVNTNISSVSFTGGVKPRDIVNPVVPNPPQTTSTGFGGPSLQTMATTLGFYNIPPDTQGAIGPNHVMFMANGLVQIYNRTGALLSSVSLDSFSTITVSGVATHPVGGSFDPRVVYDRRSGKWFATAMEFGSGNTNGGIILLVSRTNDPTGTWDKYFVNIGTAGQLTDYSTLGVDINGVYIATSHFTSSFQNNKIAAIPIATMLYDSTTNPNPTLGTVNIATGITGFFGTPHPASNIDNSAAAGRAWIIGATTLSSGGLRYRTVAWAGTVPTIDAVNSTLTIGGTFGAPLKFKPLSTTQVLDTGDPRLQSAFIRNNSIWCSRTIGLNNVGLSTTVDRNGCEWFQVNVSAAVATATQSGRVFDAGATPRHYFYPTLAVNGQGQVAMTFSGATTGEFVGDYTCGRLPGDAPGTMQGILQTKAGQDQYTVTFTSNNSGPTNRFGDYSYTSVDPNDDQSIWGFSEFAATRGSNTLGSNIYNPNTTPPTTFLNVGIDGNWQLWAQKLFAPAPTAAASTAVTVIPGQVNVSLPITGTGLFDPGASFPSRLAASSTTGISNVRIAYISPTQASVTFNVDNTATLGLRNVTVTNPDGQPVTISNAINVVAAQPVLSFTRTITDTGSAWRVALTINNTGGSVANNVRVLTSLLGATPTSTATPIIVGNIAAGGSAVVNIDFPIVAATPNVSTIHRVTGDYTGNTFSSAVRVTP